MTETNYAFPNSVYSPQLGEVMDQHGLTKREFFAAIAMQGLLTAPELDALLPLEEMAVDYADRLIRALNQQPVGEEANDESH